MMPAAIVFEGELTGSAGSIPTSGVDNCTERRGEQRAKSKTSYKPQVFVSTKNIPGKRFDGSEILCQVAYIK